jgi:hypothetical protein
MADKATTLVPSVKGEEFTKVVFVRDIPLDKLFAEVKAEQDRARSSFRDIWYMSYNKEDGYFPGATPHGLALLAGSPFSPSDFLAAYHRAQEIWPANVHHRNPGRYWFCYVTKEGKYWCQPNVLDLAPKIGVGDIVSASLYRLEVVKTKAFSFQK